MKRKKRWHQRRRYHGSNMLWRADNVSIFQRLYDSEINFEVSCFWDGEFDVRLGDAINGFVAQDKVPTWEEVAPWLRAQALFHYPHSGFAKGELGTDWKPADALPTSERKPREGP
jgi:hypothetical protein